MQLTAKERPTGISYAWSSSNPAVALVGSDGNVTAMSVGTAEITAKITEDVKATATIRVVGPKPPGGPLLAFPAISDTHVGNSSSRFAEVLQGCAEINPYYDAITISGDLTESGADTQLDNFKSILEANVVPGATSVFTTGNHDGNPGNLANFQARIGMDDWITKKEVNGYTFITYRSSRGNSAASPQAELDVLDGYIEASVTADPSKPVFIMTHFPLENTVGGSETRLGWYTGGNAELRAIFDKYPQIVLLNGHLHYTSYHPRNIYQDNFTMIDAGCSKYICYGYDKEVYAPSWMRQHLYVEVYEDRIVVQRYEFGEDTPEAIGDPYIIDLPTDGSAIDPATFRYTSARDVETPEFPADKKFKVEAVASKSATIKFDSAEDDHAVVAYSYTVNGGAVRYINPRFFEEPETCTLSLTGLVENDENTIVITPIDGYDKEGTPWMITVDTSQPPPPTPANVSGITVTDKVYDGQEIIPVGIPAIEDEYWGEPITDIIPVYTYAGIDGTVYAPTNAAPKNAGKYSLTISLPSDSTYANTGAPIEFSITQAPLTVDGVAASNKAYDGNTDVTVTGVTFGGLQNGETLALETDYEVTGAAFASANAGDNIAVTGTVALKATELANNYALADGAFPGSVQANITQAPLTVDNAAASNKVYNGNADVTVTGVTFGGLQNGETLAWDTDYEVTGAAFTSANAGSNVAVTGTVALKTTALTNNYALADGAFPASVRANIAKAPLTVNNVAVSNKAYDGKANAAVTGVTFGGLQNGETLALDTDYGVTGAAFASANVGNNIAVTGTVALKATGLANNYALADGTFPGSVQANITKAPLTVDSVTVKNKTYDGKDEASVTGVTFGGLQNGETLALDTDYEVTGATFASAKAGSNIAVTGTVALKATALTNNYALADGAFPADTKANITAVFQGGIKAPVTISGVSFGTTPKVYDGKAVASEGAVKIVEVGSDQPITGITPTYTYVGTGSTTYGPSSTAPTDAGTYTVTVAIPADNPSYTGSADISFSIEPKEIIVRAEDKSVIIGEEMPTFTYKVTGLVGDDTLTTAPSFSNAVLNTNTKGSYAITPHGAEASANYTIKYANGTLIVSDWNPFEDVVEGDWFYENVRYVYERELFNGTSETLFSPNAPLSRGMLVTVLGRYEKVDIASYTGTPFEDVVPGWYYTPYVEWAKENEIVLGIDATHFGPDLNVTREQIAAILYRYVDAKALTLPEDNAAVTFNDASEISEYAKTAVSAMQRAGVINGKLGNLFDPQGAATRAEAAAMMHRFILAVQ